MPRHLVAGNLAVVHGMKCHLKCHSVRPVTVVYWAPAPLAVCCKHLLLTAALTVCI
jgi:hypothetical protein